MPKLTNRQWDEYQAIIRKCRTLEIEARSSRALQAQVAALTASCLQDGAENDQLTVQVAALKVQLETDAKAYQYNIREQGIGLSRLLAERDLLTAELEELRPYKQAFFDVRKRACEIERLYLDTKSELEALRKSTVDRDAAQAATNLIAIIANSRADTISELKQEYANLELVNEQDKETMMALTAERDAARRGLLDLWALIPQLWDVPETTVLAVRAAREG